MRRFWFALGSVALVLCLLVWRYGTDVGAQADPPPSGAGQLPEGWAELSPVQFLAALDERLADPPPPSDGTLEAIADRIFSFLADATFTSTGDSGLVLSLAERLSDELDRWYSPERRAVLEPLLNSRLSSESAALRTGSFDEQLSARWEPALRAGVRRDLVAQAAGDWVAAHGYAALSPGRLARLVPLLEDDLADRLSYSVRLTGIFRPDASGPHGFAARIRGGEIKTWLSGAIVLQGTGPLPSPCDGSFVTGASVELEASQPYELRVEYSFSGTREGPSKTFNLPQVPQPEGLSEQSLAVLLVKEGQGDHECVGESFLTPPDGFAPPGTRGLKLEVFRGTTFTELTQTRLSRDAVLVLSGASPASARRTLQEEIASAAADRVLEGSYLTGTDIQELFEVTRSLAEYTSVAETLDLLRALAENARAMTETSAYDIAELLRAVAHVPGSEPVDVACAWIELEPAPPVVFGAYPVWGKERASFNRSSYGGYAHLASHFLSEERLERLKATLLEADGRTNLRAASILAFAYRELSRIEEWQSFLDSKLAAEGVTGDKRASWLLARAFVGEVEKGRMRPTAGLPWLDQALESAESEGSRLAVLGALSSRLAAVDLGERATAILDSLEGQFAQPASLQAIASWREKISELDAWADTFRVEEERRVKIEELKGQIAFFESKLAEIEASGGDVEAEANVEARIAEAQEELETVIEG